VSFHRFFLIAPLPAFDAEETVALPLSADDLHHAVSVLRLAPGDEIVVVGVDRTARTARLTRVETDLLEGALGEPMAPVFSPRVTLIQGLAKGDKLDLVVEKVTEIGVEAVMPVAFARSVVKLDSERGAKRGDRLRRVAAAAAKQAQRDFVPAVFDPLSFGELDAHLDRFDVVLVAWEDAGAAPGIGAALAAANAGHDSRIAIIVGPEGGLTEAEVASLRLRGAILVGLGDTVLRTETAGILSAALCVYESGGLGGRVRD